MRAVLSSWLAALTLVAGAIPAVASHPGPHFGESANRNSYIGRRPPSTIPGAGPSRSGGPGGGDPAIWDIGLGTDPTDGGLCWQPETGGTRTLGDVRAEIGRYHHNGNDLDACPATPPDPRQLLPGAWDQVRPPPPAPLQVDPGWALTGMPAYLEIGGPNPANRTLLGFAISMYPRYVVHWGDGATTDAGSSQGGPWPDGDVTHTYRDAGHVQIVVEAYWHARVPALDLNLPELAVPSRAQLDLQVRQIQAVRNR